MAKWNSPTDGLDIGEAGPAAILAATPAPGVILRRAERKRLAEVVILRRAERKRSRRKSLP